MEVTGEIYHLRGGDGPGKLPVVAVSVQQGEDFVIKATFVQHELQFSLYPYGVNRVG
jgi:hypothetical protein